MEKLTKLLNTIQYLKERFIKFRYKGILGVVFVFFLITVILFTERSGISFKYGRRALNLLPEEQIVTTDSAYRKQPKTTLILRDYNREETELLYEQFEKILTDMKVGYDIKSIYSSGGYNLDDYEVVIVMTPDITPMGENSIALTDWVYKGGKVFFPMTLEKTPHLTIIESKLGIIDSSYDTIAVDKIYVDENFMIGGGRTFTVDDPFESAWAVQLDTTKVKIHAYTDNKYKVPLVWESEYGKGKFVVDNFGLYEKVMRGFFAASYSLLSDICVYPVINGSVFYLDDFPSQIPSGNNEYIQRDYQTSIRDFYVNIWWPDMMNFADKYKIKYTGLAIECYDDETDGSTPSEADKGTFLNFGNMLLRQGGEIGYHGYNHQPLCLSDCDYKGAFSYKTWKNTDAIKNAFSHLTELCDELFPGVDMQIYVPPSNIFSKQGEALLQKEFPQIKTVSGIYFPDSESEYSWVQEFEVSKNGFVDQPRIVSGCDIDNFMSLAVISELNFHFVNSHFTHPDDALDPERGAELGWEELKVRFESYLNWLSESSPNLRNLTGTEMSAAVQRYCALTVKKEIKDDTLTVKLGNFCDEAFLMLRFNDRKPAGAKGGNLTKITGDLYLLKADSDTVTVSLK